MNRHRSPGASEPPRSELSRSRARRQRQDSREPIPWLWLGLGVLVTIFGIIAAVALASLMLAREPLSSALPTPTIIRLTAPPSSVPSPTSLLPTPTPLPTFTPPPTPDRSVAPDEVTIGYYAQVSNTANIGVSLRGGPSTDNIRIELVAEGANLLVIGGPEEGSGFEWWQVRMDDGTEGWIAADFLVPSAQEANE